MRWPAGEPPLWHVWTDCQCDRSTTDPIFAGGLELQTFPEFRKWLLPPTVNFAIITFGIDVGRIIDSMPLFCAALWTPLFSGNRGNSERKDSFHRVFYR